MLESVLLHCNLAIRMGARATILGRGTLITMNATRFSFGPVNRLIFEDSLRTAMAAVASFLIARLLQMPEAYWATISAIIVAQSSLGAAATISWQRLAGTVLGAGSGALLATYFRTN